MKKILLLALCLPIISCSKKQPTMTPTKHKSSKAHQTKIIRYDHRADIKKMK